MLTFDAFLRSLEAESPPAMLDAPLAALW